MKLPHLSAIAGILLTLAATPAATQTNSCAGEQFEVVKQGAWQHGGRFCLGAARQAFHAGGDFVLHSTNGNVVVRFSAAPNGNWIRSGTIRGVPNPRLNSTFDAMVFIGTNGIVFRNTTAGNDLPGSFY